MVCQVRVIFLSCALFLLCLCTVQSVDKEGDIHLAGSVDLWQGRVEIFHNKTWGTICDDFWDQREGQVICRQLGYSDVIQVYSRASFGQGTGPIWLDNVHCNGTESKITDCPNNGWGVHNCRHSEDGGVACVHQDTNPTNTGSCSFDDDLCGYTNAIDDDFDWTQNQNSTPSFLTGPTHDHTTGYGSYIYIETSHPRVQGEMARIISPQVSGINCVKFFYHMQGETICELNVYIDDGTDMKMVWTQKGQVSGVWENAAIPVKGYSTFKIVFEALTGTQHTGDIAIDDVAAVMTSCDSLVPSNAKPIAPDLSNISSTIRLVGNVSSAGRIEVYHEGRWGTICGSHFHLASAKVVCRQLGFLDVETLVPCCSIHKPGKGIIWLDNLHCEGREPAITMCPHRGWGMTKCVHTRDVGVICKTEDTLKKLRLQGSDNDYEGRVEVRIGGMWGTIMDIGWDIYDSTVVCRQLGFSGASAVFNAAHYGIGKGPIWLSSARCLGNETSFSQCNVTQHQIQWNHPWWWNPHRHDAGVECYNLRLTGGKSNSEGLVEIYLNGAWGTICNQQFDTNDAQVVCRQTGYSKVVSIELGYSPVPSNGSNPFITRLKCKGDESALGLCQYDVLIGNIHGCTHTMDAVVKCADPLPTAVPPTGCAQNCPSCIKNSKHGGICLCSRSEKNIKCDATTGVDVLEATFTSLAASEFKSDDFKTKVVKQLNTYCGVNSCGSWNASSIFNQDDIIITALPFLYHKHLNLQFIVLSPNPQSKKLISPEIITIIKNKDKMLGGYSVLLEAPPRHGPQKGAGTTIKIVVPIVVLLVVIGVVAVVFIMYRRKMFHGTGGAASQRYLHLSRDRTDDHDDPLLTMDDDDAMPTTVTA